MDTVEVNGEVIDTTILDKVELHCDVLIGGQVTTYSELLDSPLYKWTLQRVDYDELTDVSTLHLEDTAW